MPVAVVDGCPAIMVCVRDKSVRQGLWLGAGATATPWLHLPEERFLFPLLKGRLDNIKGEMRTTPSLNRVQQYEWHRRLWPLHNANHGVGRRKRPEEVRVRTRWLWRAPGWSGVLGGVPCHM